jgi:glycosyltransferase involved in cell wall biosynthesis
MGAVNMGTRILVVGARGVDGHEGGVEKFAEQLVRRRSPDDAITLVCLSGKKPRDFDNVEVVVAPALRALKTDKLFYYLYAAWLAISRKFDCVVLLGINSAAMIPLLLMKARTRPRIMVRSGSVDYTLKKWGWFARFIFRQAEGFSRYADKVIAVSEDIQRHLSRRGIKSIVIRNGIGTGSSARIRNPSEHPFNVIAVGRVTPDKNYVTLIKAAAILGPDYAFTIVGGGDLSGEKARLEDLVKACGITNVRFTGPVSRQRVEQLLQGASLFVNCSIQEGMSNATLEAIEVGVPVILSDIKANRELGLSNESFFESTSPEALADKIRSARAGLDRFIVPRRKIAQWDDVIKRFYDELRQLQ